MSGSIDDSQADRAKAEQSEKERLSRSIPSPHVDAEESPDSIDSTQAENQPDSPQRDDDAAWAEMDRVLSEDEEAATPSAVEPAMSSAMNPAMNSAMNPEMNPAPSSAIATAQPPLPGKPPLSMVETAFLASTASLLWLVSYYLSIGPWMRILFPAPIALVYLRWGSRAAWMSTIVSCLLLSVLMGPYLSLLFLIPYGLLGMQLGMLWRRGVGWPMSIAVSSIVSTFSFFFRLWILSAFIGEDLWVYLTGRITDLLAWASNRLVDWGLLGVGMLGQPDVSLVQLATIGMVIFSDIVYLFTVHLAAWLLFERLGNPIPEPPTWVKILLEEE